MALTKDVLTENDLLSFADHVREADLVEAAAAGGFLRESVEVQRGRLRANLARYYLWSRYNPEVRNYSLKSPDGDLVAIGGYSTTGVVWFMCTDHVTSYRKSFMKAIKQFRDDAWNHSTCLTNIMMWDNVLHRRFLEALGADFSVGDVQQLSGKSFVRFYLTDN